MTDQPTTEPAEACPLTTPGGPRTAHRLADWTLTDGDGDRAVTLPHTWNAADAVGGEPGYDRDRKTYRRTVDPDAGSARHLLHFEGANQTAEVRVDGDLVGRHEGGYTAFTVDVTDALADDGPSEVAVTVDNRHDEDVPPLDADFTFFGGLYRPVWLVSTAAVALDGSEYGSTGVRVDTPVVSADRATVRVRSQVANHETGAATVDLAHAVVNEGGETVATLETDVEVAAGTDREVTVEGTVPDPDRWHPDSPTTYTVETRLRRDGSVVDRVDSPLGVRTVEVGPDGRFLLDGEPITLRGTNRHQDRPGRGNALSDADHREDVAHVADLGANFLRLAHYPQAEAVLDAADRNGLLLWEEIPVVNRVTDSERFRENCRRMAREMVHQHFNHPAVAMWGFMNEILLETDVEDDEQVAATVEVAESLEALLATEDPSRPTAMACHQGDEYDETGLTPIPDVLGWNLYVGWYGGEATDIGPVLDAKLADRPGQATVVSEYGVGADVRLHSRTPESWDFTEEYQSYYHREYLDAFDDRGDRVATAQWNAFDFASAQRADTIPDVNQKGLMTHDRQPKGVYHLYRAWLRDDPVVHVATRHWDRRAHVPDDDTGHPVRVYGNGETVELLVDGESRGTEWLDDGYSATWSVSLAPGEHTLTAELTSNTGTVHRDETTVDVVNVDARDADGLPEGGLAVNVGSDRDSLTEQRLWAAESTYAPEGSDRGPVGGTRESTLDRVHDTAAVPLYQQWLTGVESYRLPVPAGTYEVELRFCELEHEAPGDRVFDVAVNGQDVAVAFDPCEAAGASRPTSLETTVEVGPDDQVVVEFDAREGETLLNAILLRQRQ